MPSVIPVSMPFGIHLGETRECGFRSTVYDNAAMFHKPSFPKLYHSERVYKSFNVAIWYSGMQVAYIMKHLFKRMCIMPQIPIIMM